MDVLIVGAGSMGRWFAEALDARVAFADVDSDAAAAAADAVGARAVSLEGTETFDVVCLAVPMGVVGEAVASHAGRAERAVLDVTGTMAEPLAAMRECAPGRERASLHPLFAPSRAPGTIAVVVDESGPATAAVLADLEAAGNDLVETAADEHDDAMETVQAAAHAAILSFALATDPVPEEFRTPVYEGLEALVRQVAGGSPRVYADIQRRFDGAGAVAEAARRVANAEGPALEALVREAAGRERGGGDGSRDSAGGDSADGGERG